MAGAGEGARGVDALDPPHLVGEEGERAGALRPVDSLASGLPRVELDAQAESRVLMGQRPVVNMPATLVGTSLTISVRSRFLPLLDPLPVPSRLMSQKTPLVRNPCGATTAPGTSANFNFISCAGNNRIRARGQQKETGTRRKNGGPFSPAQATPRSSRPVIPRPFKTDSPAPPVRVPPARSTNCGSPSVDIAPATPAGSADAAPVRSNPDRPANHT